MYNSIGENKHITNGALMAKKKMSMEDIIDHIREDLDMLEEKIADLQDQLEGSDDSEDDSDEE